MRIFDAATVEARRQKVVSSLKGKLKTADAVLVFSGEPVQKPGGLDQTYPFLPHPEYFWLTGLRRPRGVVIYSPDLGWFDFAQPISNEEKLWEGTVDTGETFGQDVAQFETWLRSRDFGRLFTLGQPGPNQTRMVGQYGQPSPEEAETVQECVNRARRPKDAAEVALVRKIASIAGAGYRHLSQLKMQGLTEREVQIGYEAEVLRAGSEKFPYETIVGSGTNSAVLHAIPTTKVIKENEMVLVDAGADVADYCVDITRVFPSSGQFTQQQRDLYELVLKSQEAAISACRPGVEWHDVHRTAARVLAEGLKRFGILECEVDSALQNEAISVFLPHGVGHMVGLRVRDVGAVAGRPSRTCCGVRVRVDLALEENFLMTVEPGLYFVKALLDRADVRARFKTEINWSEVEKWRAVGGVRIEDDILVGKAGPVNLTAEVAK